MSEVAKARKTVVEGKKESRRKGDKATGWLWVIDGC